ncbi:hypothetical protein EST38_g10916 [Candolleomyces aberdarensis]|uniref:Uncharacterized protein n=1 Tax=Candolleomyces aberdarensis TaxID=2316362 RepID=A0A4V1Q2F8_9AGAR|nr:hypothetical protein EST38_g10916 [Candolleomyces aberdarensis]
MLTVLKEASAGVPILRPVAGSVLAILENVQLMDRHKNLIAQILVEIIETTFVVAIALSSNETDAPVTDSKLAACVDELLETLEDITTQLVKRLEQKSSNFSRFTRAKGYKNEINGLREKLHLRREALHLFISAYTYRGTVCRLPVGSAELQKHAEVLAQSKCDEWQQLQQQYLNGASAGPGAVMNSQVGTVTAKKATKNAVGTMGTIYNGDGCTGNNTIYNFGPRGETKHNNTVGSIGNYNAGDVYATLNQGCNTMYFDRSQYSQEPMNEEQWDQQQQWPPQGMNSPPTHAPQCSQEPATQAQWQQQQWPSYGTSYGMNPPPAQAPWS